MTRRLRVALATGAAVVAAALVSACGGGSGEGGQVVQPVGQEALKPDAAFASQGVLQFAEMGGDSSLRKVVELGGGGMLVAGMRQLSEAPGSEPEAPGRRANVIFVKRLMSDGSPDVSFGTAGTSEFSLRGADTVLDMLPLSDGTVAVTAFASEPCTFTSGGPIGYCVGESSGTGVRQGLVLAKLDRRGALDRSAVPQGFTELTYEQGNTARLALQRDKLLVLVNTSYVRGSIFGWTLERYLVNGSLDVSFGKNGSIGSRCETDGERLQVAADQSIWVLGARGSISYVQPEAALGICLEHLSEDGAVGTAPVRTPLGANVSITSARILGDGSLVVAGSTSKDSTRGMFAVKYAADGSLKTDYGDNGIARALITDAASTTLPRWSVISADGAVLSANIGSGLVAGGDSTGVPRTWMRWTPDGRADENFGTRGQLVESSFAPETMHEPVLMDSLGRWVSMEHATVNSNPPSGTVRLGIMRLQGLSGR